MAGEIRNKEVGSDPGRGVKSSAKIKNFPQRKEPVEKFLPQFKTFLQQL